jgi:hypothetical protein
LGAEFKRIAESLSCRHVDQLVLCKSGRNSRVYKVVCGDDAYALKSYPPKNSDPRDRFGTEVRALKYYEASENPYAPRLLALDPVRNVTLLEWLDGEVVGNPAVCDIEQALDFIARTHAARALGGEAFGLASEPCLSGADLYRHISVRLEKLIVLPELKSYLASEIVPLLELAHRNAENSAFTAALPKSKQTLIPADFGFHNAIKTDTGRVRFIDFEYFGWDDPVRLAADFLLHPSLELDVQCANQFRSGMISLFRTDECFESRLLNLLPLYAVRWVLILLNEFLPERWDARVFAGETASHAKIKARQLKKARLAADKVVASLELP